MKLGRPKYDTLYCPCGNAGIKLPDGRFKRQDGAVICERCKRLQAEMDTWMRDSEILARRAAREKVLENP